MRKGRDGGKTGGKKRKENTDENSGHYVIASSRPPERRPLERRTLAPIKITYRYQYRFSEKYRYTDTDTNHTDYRSNPKLKQYLYLLYKLKKMHF